MTSFLANLTGAGETFTSKNPLKFPKKGKYKSPSGKISTFDFEDVESHIATKAAVFESVGGNGTYVQPNGITSGRFPMNCLFHGPKHKELADYFTGSCLETTGPGMLTHPSYSRDIFVVPVGEIARIDNFVTAANQTIISISFYETTGLQIGAKKGLQQLFDSFSELAAVDFAASIQLKKPGELSAFKSRLRAIMKTITTAMKKASGAVAKVNQGIEDAGDSINRGMDIMVGQPLALARQCQMMIGEPRRQNVLVTGKFDAYKNLAKDIFNRTIAEPMRYSNDIANQFHMNRLITKSIVANSAMLYTNTSELKKRKEFLDTADAIKTLKSDLQEWNDANYAVLGGEYLTTEATDMGGGDEELQDLVSAISGQLVAQSFSGLTEIKKELESDRTPLDLCFELYGTTEWSIFDQFVESNNLIGDEYFLIPKGRIIAQYV